MNVFENTLYINLDERVDRREHFLQEYAKLIITKEKGEVSPHRIAATKLTKGAIGCSMSHIKAVEYAKERGWEQVFVCEDDITFMQPKELLSVAKIGLNTVLADEWDVLIIGGNNWPPFVPRSDNCIQVHNCMSTTGYVVKRRYYDTLLLNFKEGVRLFLQNPDKAYLYAIDVWWKKLQVRDRWFMVIPATVDQWTNNYSNVESCVTSYSHLMLNHTKNGQWLSPNRSWKMMQPLEKAAFVAAPKPWLAIQPMYKRGSPKKMQMQVQVR